MQARIPIALIFLCSCFFSAFGQNAEERLRLIRADVLKREKVDGQVQQVLEGNVEFQQAETTITCDVAKHLMEQELAVLSGNVHIYDEARTLTADTVYIYQKQKKQIAVGDVISISEEDTTFADRMTYLEREDKVISEGNVRIVDIDEESIVTGGYAEYWRERDHGMVLQEPVLIRLDSLGHESLRIRADTLETTGERTIASGNVDIVQKRLRATCGKAIQYKSDERINLYQEPKIEQKSYTIAGDTLKLHLSESQLERAVVIGDAVATSQADTLSPGRWVNRLSGARMEFLFQEEELDQIIIENQASSLYHVIEDDAYKGSNEVTGDRIVIELSDDEAESVLVSSNPDVATGTYSPPQ